MSVFCSAVIHKTLFSWVFTILQFQRNCSRLFIQTSSTDKYWLIRPIPLYHNYLTLTFPMTLTFPVTLKILMTLTFPMTLCSLSLFRILQSFQETVQDFLWNFILNKYAFLRAIISYVIISYFNLPYVLCFNNLYFAFS